MKRNLGLAIAAVRELGVYPVWLYSLYEFQRRVGWLRFRTPIRDWNAFSLHQHTHVGIPTSPESYCKYRTDLERRFFFGPEENLSHKLKTVLIGDEEILLSEADGIVQGNFSLFGKPPQKLGFPLDWDRFPASSEMNDKPLDANAEHWTKIDIDGLPGDIKLLWELSRFGWVYTLGRAFRLSGDQKYAQDFWRLLESWCEVNPPNRGFHWISGQEVAIRLLALIFAHYAFHPYLKEEPKRMVLLTETIAAHAIRIPPTLNYSRSQGNNHLIVEAVGLYSAGLLFPELKDASRWCRIGRRWFISALSNQVFSDGGYVQHSVNYQRLALQASLWVFRLAELNGESVPQATQKSIGKMSTCLRALMDTNTGKVPNFGPNDGALIFPLTTCSYHDYRPVIQTSNQLMFGERVFKPGPWDEAGIWLGIKEEAPILIEKVSTDMLSKDRKSFPEAGLHLLGGGDTWGLFRCAKFNNRPGHSDQLHFDLWWRGENIARDPGTFLYNGVDHWENGLAISKVHNTIVVDELEPMWRAGRFLWLNWAQGEILVRSITESGDLEFITGQHNGHLALGITTLRSVARAGDSQWLVVDELRGPGIHKLRSGWLLPDTPWEMEGNTLTIETTMGKIKIELLSQKVQWGMYRAGEMLAGEDVTDCKQILGWYSSTYAHKDPGLYLAATVEGELPLRLVTKWCLGDIQREELVVEWDETGLSPISPKRIIFGEEVLEF